MNERTDIVITTIGDGAFLDDFASALREPGVRLVVIPDRRTPRALYEACERAQAAGASILCPDVAEQDRLLTKLGVAELMPYDSDNRRNIGYLLSWLDGVDVVVSMDDDNLPAGHPFVAKHREVLRGPAEHRVVSAESGWFNVCDLLTVTPCRVFPRGFPYRARDSHRPRVRARRERADVRINAGLWLGDPDVDAVTRLATSPAATAYGGEDAVLDQDTWCPVNSQNTAVHRDALPAYYFLRMGQPIGGLRLERFGDIFSGYFVQACAKRLGHSVRFGDPLVSHPRNEHDLLHDLSGELPAIRILDEILEWLRDHRLDGADYPETYESLSHGLQDFAEQASGRAWGPEARAFLHRSAHLMRTWLAALRRGSGA